MIATDHPLHPLLLTFARLALWPALCAILGFAGAWHWLLDLLAHFRWQYLAALALGLLAALLVRRRGLVLLLASTTLVNAWALVSASGPAPTGSGAPDARPIKLLVANIHHGMQDFGPLLALIERESPHVIGLLEVAPAALDALAPLAEHYPVRRIEARDDPFGIGLWSRLPDSGVTLVETPPLGFPALRLDWPAPGSGNLWLVHPFPPLGGQASGWRDQQLEHTAGLLAGQADALLAGDLNTTPWSHAYRQLRTSTGLADSRAGGWPWPTWSAGPMPFLFAVPIDHVLHGAAWRTTRHEVGPDIGSDHRPLLVELVRAHPEEPLR